MWDNRKARRQRRENPTLERDGWRCTAHHQNLLHKGRMRCRGWAADGLTWELGTGRGRPA